jgi:hypothetical protein
MLIFVSPPGFEQFFVELSDAQAQGRELSPHFYDELASRYGLLWD